MIDATSADGSTGLFTVGSPGPDSQGAGLADIRPGAAFRVGRSGANVIIDYTFVAVPEPATLPLAALGCLLLGYGATRRRTTRVADVSAAARRSPST